MGTKGKLLFILLVILLGLFGIFQKEFFRSQKMILSWDSKTKSFFLNKDKNTSSFKKNITNFDRGSGNESCILKNGKFKIIHDGSNLWESPDDWYVTSFATSDITRDGLPDISLSVWKKGNFGYDKPFWVKENDERERNHFFVFRFENKTLKPLWQSSNLDVPNCEFVIFDVENDDKNELVVIEGDYKMDSRNCEGKYLAVWKWNGWGFTNEWRSSKGKFSNLIIEEVDGKKQVTVDMFSSY